MVNFKNKMFFFLFLAVFCAVLCSADVLEEPASVKQPITVNGDKVEYDPERQIVVGEGNVEVIYENMKLYADKMTVWLDEEIALAQNNVKLLKDGATFYAQELSYNFKNNSGRIIEPSFEGYGPWYGRGSEAEESKDSNYHVKDAYITTCDLDQPHYRLQAKSITVFPDDKVVAKNIFFYVKNVPILYLPYYKQSLKDRAMPFLIIPGKSDKWGWYLLSSYK
ncbi:MAG TPA: LPS-assembly protein LptD, partial [Candidatus Omnitrophica bacterium]|nr:LPS-assembly protein LptD [Candidatus Omnitrophota bacterium]